MPFFYTDVSTTTIINPGSVIDFICASQSITDMNGADWGKVPRINITVLDTGAFCP